MNGDLKQTFILQNVQDYLRDVKSFMEISIARKKAIDTEALLKSVVGRARANGGGATGELLFKEHGRMLDMGVGRGHPLGGLKTTTVNLQSRKQSGKVFVKDNIRKPKKIYASVAYGRLIYLQNRLLYGYTEAAIAALQNMKNAGNTIT